MDLTPTQQAYLKALKPKSIIKVANLDKGDVPKGLMKDINQALVHKYMTFLDIENGVIYVGNRL